MIDLNNYEKIIVLKLKFYDIFKQILLKSAKDPYYYIVII